MIVVVIIGLLAGAVTLSTRHYLDRAKGNRAKTDIATFRSAIETFYGEEGRYPTTDEGIEALVPEYIDQLRQDPWGRPYQYVQPGRTAPYEIICYGADGRAGGEGADADIGSAAAEGLSD
jgi:general secretion pathway protein G